MVIGEHWGPFDWENDESRDRESQITSNSFSLIPLVEIDWNQLNLCLRMNYTYLYILKDFKEHTFI